MPSFYCETYQEPRKKNQSVRFHQIGKEPFFLTKRISHSIRSLIYINNARNQMHAYALVAELAAGMKPEGVQVIDTESLNALRNWQPE